MDQFLADVKTSLRREPATAWWPCPRASTTPTAPSSPRPRPPPPTALATPSWAVWPPCWPTWSSRRLGAKVRGIELSLLQRCGSHLASRTDIRGSLCRRQGRGGGRRGRSDRPRWWPWSCTRDADGYRLPRPSCIPLTQVANTEKQGPPRRGSMKQATASDQSFIDYALPLIQGEPARPLENGLPKFARLKKVLTTSID